MLSSEEREDLRNNLIEAKKKYRKEMTRAKEDE